MRGGETVIDEAGAAAINAGLGVAATGEAILDAPGQMFMNMAEGQRQ